jgi:hypothetical protein
MCSLVRFFERNESEPERYIERAQSRYAEKVFRLVWERPVALFCRMFEHCLRSRTFYTDDLTEDGDKGWTFSLRRAQELIDDAKFLCANWDSSCELENCRLCVACCQRLPVLATENAQYITCAPSWVQLGGVGRFHRWRIAREAKQQDRKESKTTSLETKGAPASSAGVQVASDVAAQGTFQQTAQKATKAADPAITMLSRSKTDAADRVPVSASDVELRFASTPIAGLRQRIPLSSSTKTS